MSIIAIDVIASRKSRMQKFELVPPPKKNEAENQNGYKERMKLDNI